MVTGNIPGSVKMNLIRSILVLLRRNAVGPLRGSAQEAGAKQHTDRQHCERYCQSTHPQPPSDCHNIIKQAGSQIWPVIHTMGCYLCYNGRDGFNKDY